ncbi:MAG: enolase C-terminal domain-like protein [bacterium]|nr:enolase C-terminal domain-like protein [bacterium]
MSFRIARIGVHPLAIPFREGFRHHLHERAGSDAIVIRVEDADGLAGHGEGLPRPYVTGETVESVMMTLSGSGLERLLNLDWPDVHGVSDLEAIDALLGDLPAGPGVRAAHAARSALEVAILDLALRRSGISLGEILPAVRNPVIYSGVLTSTDPSRTVELAMQMAHLGLKDLKIKVGDDGDVARVQAVRAALGPDIRLRLDANAAWNLETATERLQALEEVAIASVEQPLPVAQDGHLPELRRRSSIPVMVDESVVTEDDAARLIEMKAVDILNVRISKQGGLVRARRLALTALQAGVGVQIGAQVGETAILSAAGRHLAAHLPEVFAVEGSFGTLLLNEDLTAQTIRFGHGGRGPRLTGPGLGVDVLAERLARWRRES